MPDTGTYIGWIAPGVLILDWALRIGLALRVIMLQRHVGASLAWLAVIFAVPFAGAILYLLIGERRIGRRRFALHRRIDGELRSFLETRVPAYIVQEAAGVPDPMVAAIQGQGFTSLGVPPLRGNRLELIDDADRTLRTIIEDIDAAERWCNLEFYIWNQGGTADEVVEALIRASHRGVVCRVLLDALGSKTFLASAMVARMRAAGIHVVASMPMNVLLMVFTRFDLRNHRKIVVVDDRVAYTGSQNLAEAGSFAKGLRRGAGPWVDTMVRVRGPVVSVINAIFVHDWEVEGAPPVDRARELVIEPGEVEGDDAVVQVIPSGPGIAPEAIHRMLLTTIYAARSELLITTPYFVPDDAMLTALISASERGVDVTLVLPKRVDSHLVRLASRANFGRLLAAGVRVAEFREGLLHSKTITVDGRLALIGSVNLDMRSFWLNFEITLFAYDVPFVTRLRAVQLGYRERSDLVDASSWEDRPFPVRLLESTVRLLGPVL